MLRDRFFYPLAMLIILAIVGLALSFGGGEEITDSEILAEGWTLSGPALNGLTISPGSNGAYIDEDGGFMRLSQFTPDGVGPTSIGVFATLGPIHERAFSGQALEITLRARASRSNPLNYFETAYFPMESEASGWTKFDLTPEWQDYQFSFTPPIVDAPENVDLITVFPGREGKSEQMDLASIRVEVANAE